MVEPFIDAGLPQTCDSPADSISAPERHLAGLLSLVEAHDAHAGARRPQRERRSPRGRGEADEALRWNALSNMAVVPLSRAKPLPRVPITWERHGALDEVPRTSTPRGRPSSTRARCCARASTASSCSRGGWRSMARCPSSSSASGAVCRARVRNQPETAALAREYTDGVSLDAASLLRLRLLSFGRARRALLLTTVHHIVEDDWSLRLVVERVQRCQIKFEREGRRLRAGLGRGGLLERRGGRSLGRVAARGGAAPAPLQRHRGSGDAPRPHVRCVCLRAAVSLRRHAAPVSTRKAGLYCIVVCTLITVWLSWLYSRELLQAFV